MAARAPLPPEIPKRDGGYTARHAAGGASPRSRRGGGPPEDGVRTGAPARGHAYHADQARRALGISSEPRLAEVPFPIIHAALGVAACAVAVALRPGAVGLFGMPVRGSIPALVGVLLLFLVTASAQGLFLSTLSDKQETAFSFAGLLTMLGSALFVYLAYTVVSRL